ncbi:MAG TPA: asparagine synthetase B, partial [Rhodospirillaceae bacterium]|nr:asparagine synthetase B [Rhodospirillaceae bacterium]
NRPELNRNAIITGLVHNMRHIPEPHTAYQGFLKLRPGHAMIVKGGRIQTIWRHYDPLAGQDAPTDATQLRALLEDAVACRMVADVPVA